MTEAEYWSNLEGGTWIGLILAAIPIGLLIYVLLWKREPVLRVLGFFRVDDTIDDQMRKDATEACKLVAKISRDVPRLKLQDMMVDAAKRGQAIAFSRAYPHKTYDPRMFTANCIVTGHIAVVELWPGPDYTSDGEGIEPINILIDRERRPQHYHALKPLDLHPEREDQLPPVGTPTGQAPARAAAPAPAKLSTAPKAAKPHGPVNTPAGAKTGKPGPARKS